MDEYRYVDNIRSSLYKFLLLSSDGDGFFNGEGIGLKSLRIPLYCYVKSKQNTN